MATVLLIRHGVSSANTNGILAGRMPGVSLTDRGQDQAQALAERLAQVTIQQLVSSPMERCQQTVAPLASSLGVVPILEADLTECDYGTWSGRSLTDLSAEPLWDVVQRQPSAATFPEGESLAQMSARAVRTIRGIDQQIEEQFGAHAVWVACTHGDIIKAVVADAMGMHLDLFQRILIDPASITTIRFGHPHPHVISVNDSGHISGKRSVSGSLAHLVRDTDGHDGDPAAGIGAVGGGAGPQTNP